MEYSGQTIRRAGVRGLFALCVLSAIEGRAEAQTLPGLSVGPAKAAASAKDKPTTVATKDNPEATMTTAQGTINVKPTNDLAIRHTLEDLLPNYPGVRSVTVRVSNGVVTLDGHATDDDNRDDVTKFAQKVEGVRMVLNTMQTDEQVLSAKEHAGKVLREIRDVVTRKWLLALIGLALFVVFAGLARLMNTYSETLLSPFLKNVMLRSVFGSLLSSLLVFAGLMLGLWVVDLTHAVLSILGLAGVVGLAVGFAFRDITENFIASVLLGMRRPFRVGDYIKVASHEGVVQNLNTRATVLVTLDGNHIRIPNNIIYKEILVNSSASTSARGTFDVLVPYEASTANALEAVTNALRAQDEVLRDPPARALVEALESAGVRLRAYFWMAAQGVDGFKLTSDLKLKTKVALQRAGIAPPMMTAAVSVVGRVPVEVSQAEERDECSLVLRPGAIHTTEQAEANLHRDAQAAAVASAAPVNGHETPMEHALNEAQGHVREEGENLIANGAPREG